MSKFAGRFGGFSYLCGRVLPLLSAPVLNQIESTAAAFSAHATCPLHIVASR